MNARTALALAAAALAALAPAAAAKEISGATVCGASGCTNASDKVSHAVVEGGPVVAPPTQGAAYYELRLTIRGEDGRAHDTFANLYLPGPNLLRGADGNWMQPGADVAVALKRLVSGVRPFSAARLERDAPEVRAMRAAMAPATAGGSSGGGQADDAGGGTATLVLAAGLLAAAGAAGLLTARRMARRRRAAVRPPAVPQQP